MRFQDPSHTPAAKAGNIDAAGSDQDPQPFDLRIRSFAGALLDPDIAIPDGIGKGGDTFLTRAPKRFSVYRNNVVVGLMEAMRAAYPSVLAIMGSENFDRVARNYIATHPPASALMQQYGQTFPEFLRQFKPLAKSPFLADVAVAEMNWLKAFHARDETVLTGEELQSLEGEAVMEVCLQPHPAQHIVKSGYPVFHLFEARNIWPRPGISLAQPQSIIISRPVYECMATPLTEPVADFIELLNNGRALGEALEAIGSDHSGFDAPSAIAIILQTGAFQSINQTGKRNIS